MFFLEDEVIIIYYFKMYYLFTQVFYFNLLTCVITHNTNKMKNANKLEHIGNGSFVTALEIVMKNIPGPEIYT